MAYVLTESYESIFNTIKIFKLFDLKKQINRFPKNVKTILFSRSLTSSNMQKFVLLTICIALASADVPPMGGSLEDLIHEIFTPPPDLGSKGNTDGYQPGVIGQPGPIGENSGNPGHSPPSQPPVEANVRVSVHSTLQ